VAESDEERLDRELIELLNEIRVALAGAQVLFAFLLLLPFQPTFRDGNDLEHALYFVAFLASLTASVLLIGPSTFHRIRFRQRDKAALLRWSNALLLIATAAIGVALTAVAYLVTEVLLGGELGLAAALITAVVTTAVWFAVPLARRLSDD
jgi:hypothetical protein